MLLSWSKAARQNILRNGDWQSQSWGDCFIANKKRKGTGQYKNCLRHMYASIKNLFGAFPVRNTSQGPQDPGSRIETDIWQNIFGGEWLRTISMSTGSSGPNRGGH